MSTPAERRFFWVTILLFSTLVFYRLGSWGVLETSEARYAEMSWEMAETGDILHPTFLQLRHYHKPPLTYAITAGAYRLFGPSPFATRVFLQLALLLQLWLVYQTGKLLLGNSARARLAVLIYLSFPAMLIASRSLTTDLYLVTFLLLGVWCWLRSERGGSALVWTLAAYGAWGLAALTKGAGVVILPAVLLPTYYLLFPPKSWLRLFGRHLLGSILFVVVGVSWYAALIYEDRSLFDYFLIEQTVKRYTTDQWYRAQPWWFYLATVSATAFPWFWLAVGKARTLFQEGKRYREVWLLLAWVLGPLVFYSLAQSKLVLYVLPAYAGLALLSVVVLDKLSGVALRRLGVGLSAFYALVFFALILIPWFKEDVNGSAPYVIWGAVAGAVLVGGARWVSRCSSLPVKYQLLFPVVAFNVLLLPISAEFLRANELLVNSPQPVVDFLEANDLTGCEVYTLHRKLPSVTFALGKPTVMLYGGKVGRDTSRQANDAWRNCWRDVYNPAERNQLRSEWLAEPSVVIGYRNQDSLDLDLLRNFPRRERIGRYTVYY